MDANFESFSMPWTTLSGKHGIRTTLNPNLPGLSVQVYCLWKITGLPVQSTWENNNSKGPHHHCSSCQRQDQNRNCHFHYEGRWSHHTIFSETKANDHDNDQHDRSVLDGATPIRYKTDAQPTNPSTKFATAPNHWAVYCHSGTPSTGRSDTKDTDYNDAEYYKSPQDQEETTAISGGHQALPIRHTLSSLAH